VRQTAIVQQTAGPHGVVQCAPRPRQALPELRRIAESKYSLVGEMP
jgi:hypothetical protein